MRSRLLPDDSELALALYASLVCSLFLVYPALVTASGWSWLATLGGCAVFLVLDSRGCWMRCEGRAGRPLYLGRAALGGSRLEVRLA